MKITILALMFAMSSVSFAARHEAKGPDAQAVDQQCQADASTAGCNDMKVGTGLLKCLHKYKKANKSFKFSDACKTAMKQMRHDRKKQ